MERYILNKYSVEIKFRGAAGFRAIKNQKTQVADLILWFDETDDNTIAHECLHCAIYVLDTRGVKINKKNDEPACYYLGWLFCEVKKYLKPHKQ